MRLSPGALHGDAPPQQHLDLANGPAARKEQSSWKHLLGAKGRSPLQHSIIYMIEMKRGQADNYVFCVGALCVCVCLYIYIYIYIYIIFFSFLHVTPLGYSRAK